MILFAQRRFIVGTIALLLSSSAYAENILCPPPDNQASIIRGAWEPQFNGWLDEIIVSRTFVPDQAESAIITCTRTIGTMRIWLSKSCRIIAGGGMVDAMDHSKYSEMTTCKFPHMSMQRTNDKIGVIACN